MRSMSLVRLCKTDDEGIADHLAQLMSKFRLIEWPKPEPEPVPEGHDGTQPLTLGQMRTHLRDEHGAGMRVYIRPASGSQLDHGIWLVLNMSGYVWYGDATEMISGMDWTGFTQGNAKPVEDGAN